jgi:hypothetical protein
MGRDGSRFSSKNLDVNQWLESPFEIKEGESAGQGKGCAFPSQRAVLG